MPSRTCSGTSSCSGSDGGTVSLGALLSRGYSIERVEKPDVLYGQANHSKKGEDFTFIKPQFERVLGDAGSTISVFALFDGHNGSAAAIYAKENLLNNILGSIPSSFSRDQWLETLPRALVAGFVKTDKYFQDKAQTSGTTATFVVIDEWVVTVASVGDSRCILESAEGSLHVLSDDHRLEVNLEEVERITASGGEVCRLHVAGGAEIGPLRCWPGGLCLSRSIGDMDVGEFIVPIPHVKQVKLSSAGGRLVISSDGVWDALSFESALQCCRGLPPESAANEIVKDAVHLKGLRDDTTCIVVDILPSERTSPPVAPPKKQGMGVFKNIFRKKSTESSSHHLDDYTELDTLEDLFEDGSAVLAQRLDIDYILACTILNPSSCAVCQVDLKPGEGTSIHSGSSKSEKNHTWDGPYLCPTCQIKKEAMEGKRPSRGTTLDLFFHMPTLIKFLLNHFLSFSRSQPFQNRLRKNDEVKKAKSSSSRTGYFEPTFSRNQFLDRIHSDSTQFLFIVESRN